MFQPGQNLWPCRAAILAVFLQERMRTSTLATLVRKGALVAEPAFTKVVEGTGSLLRAQILYLGENILSDPFALASSLPFTFG